jgi:hypothetical protein
MDIQWKRGEFQKFYANMKIRIGGSDVISSIEKGSEFEYDGQILRYAGVEIPQPSLRGAVKANWFSLSEFDVKTPQSKVNLRNIAKSQTVLKGVNSVQRAAPNMQVDQLDEETVLNIGDRQEAMKQGRHLSKDDNRSARGMEIKESIEDQEGVVVGKVRSAAKTVTDVSSSDYSAKLNKLNNPDPIGKKPDMIRTSSTEGITITSNVEKMRSAIQVDESEGVVVGSVKETDNSDRVEGIAMGGKKSKSQSQVADPSSLKPRVRIAKMIYPEFPESWNFTGKLKERMERVKSYGENPKFLEALYAAEGDQFRKILEQEYPEQFGG